MFNQAKIELPITFKPAEQNLVTYLAPTLQRLAGWDGKPSKAFWFPLHKMMLINKTATHSFWILDFFFFLDDQKVLLPYSLATRAENVLHKKKFS